MHNNGHTWAVTMESSSSSLAQQPFHLTWFEFFREWFWIFECYFHQKPFTYGGRNTLVADGIVSCAAYFHCTSVRLCRNVRPPLCFGGARQDDRHRRKNWSEPPSRTAAKWKWMFASEVFIRMVFDFTFLRVAPCSKADSGSGRPTPASTAPTTQRVDRNVKSTCQKGHTHREDWFSSGKAKFTFKVTFIFLPLGRTSRNVHRQS